MGIEGGKQFSVSQQYIINIADKASQVKGKFTFSCAKSWVIVRAGKGGIRISYLRGERHYEGHGPVFNLDRSNTTRAEARIVISGRNVQ